jgi:serine/threonine protein kinase
MTHTAGENLGRYEIRSKSGEGGMGEVYLAQDTELDRILLAGFPLAILFDNRPAPRQGAIIHGYAPRKE